VNASQFSHKVLAIREVSRGLGHVRIVLLVCGHEKETTAPVGQIRDRMICDVCRKKSIRV
jgi:hypothetical protein